MRKLLFFVLLFIPPLAYAQISQFQSLQNALENENDSLVIKIANEMISQPYQDNNEYNEADIYIMLAAAYENLDNYSMSRKVIDSGFMKFPTDSTILQEYLMRFQDSNDEENFDFEKCNFVIDSLMSKFPQKRNLFLFIKGRMCLMQSEDNYLQAEPYYEELLLAEPKNLSALQDAGFYGMRYVYVLAEEKKPMQNLTKSEKKEHNEKILKYTRKSVEYLKKAYELSDDPEMQDLIIYYLNDAATILDNLGQNVEALTKWVQENVQFYEGLPVEDSEE